MTKQTYEAQASELRRVINFHSKMVSTEKEVAQRREQADKEKAERRAARREYETRYQENLKTFILRNSWSVILTAVVCLLDVFGIMDFWMCLSIMALAGGFLVLNFWQYINRNSKREEKENACNIGAGYPAA